MRSSVSVGLSALALAISASAAARPDLNSFINRKVTDTRSLVSQVKSDPEVADRYQRHFSMTKGEVVAYLSGLHRDKLDSEGMYPVYSVPDNGKLKMHMQKLKKGEPMFVDIQGRPVLIAKCGNPVVGSRKPKGNPPVVSVPEPTNGRELVLEEPRVTEVESPSQLVAMMPMVPPVVDAPPIVPVEPEPVVATVPATATGGGRFPWFAGLPLLFPIFGGIGGNGGGVESVPEPATMLALGAGVVGLMRRRSRRA